MERGSCAPSAPIRIRSRSERFKQATYCQDAK